MQSEFIKLFSSASWAAVVAAIAAVLTSFVWFQSEKSVENRLIQSDEIVKIVESQMKSLEDYDDQTNMLKFRFSELEERVDFYKERIDFLEKRLNEVEQQ